MASRKRKRAGSRRARAPARDSGQLPLLRGDRPRPPTAMSRATARMRSRREAPAPRPWLCVVLAVDTARRSGWCISVSGRRVDSGELDTDTVVASALLSRLVRWAVDLGASGGLPVVLVLEKPWGGSSVIVASLGAARERWLRAWREGGQSSGRVLLVQPGTWRSAVLGSGSIGLTRDVVRGLEASFVAHLMGRRVAGGDECAAILIARWASQAAQVGKVIGKRAQRASLNEWTQPVTV